MRFSQVDLLYLHNVAEMQLKALGKRRFVERLAAAFREMEKFRCSCICPKRPTSVQVHCADAC
jgi:hypothetical protein